MQNGTRILSFENGNVLKFASVQLPPLVVTMMSNNPPLAQDKRSVCVENNHKRETTKLVQKRNERNMNNGQIQ